MKKFFSEFKEFISRGSIMDMAVGIIIGGAFTAIVTALQEGILTPLLGLLFGGINFSNLSFTIGNTPFPVGQFINAVINFLLVAFALFCILKAMNSISAKAKQKLLHQKAVEEAEEAAKPDPQIELLTQIRDLLEKDNSISKK